jgi:endonuclease/exonuclease/phosphatase family metal-dependent hydrolase
MVINRSRIYLTGLLFILIFSLHAQDIKIMSYNMQQPYNTNWDGRVANVASIINSHQPDILGTQELHAYMRDQVLGRAPGYVSYGRSRECDNTGEASFIFYKSAKYDIDLANSGTFWFKDDYWVCGRGYDPSYNRICTYARLRDKATGKYFYVYNSHFPMTSMPEARKKSAALLCQMAINRAIKDPVIYTGDFNSWESEGNPIEYIKNGTSLKMRDTWRDVYPTGNVETGFGTRLDFIFLENRSSHSTLSTYVVKSPVASDHLPIVATVRIGGQITIPFGQYIWLQNGGKYVTSNNGTSAIICDRPSVQAWEKFLVVDAGGGKVALRGSNGRYVSSENGVAAMTCTRQAYSDWEKFSWVAVSSNQVALLGNNGRYVSSENGLAAMNCNRPSIDGWEKFTFGITSAGRLEMSDVSPNDETELRYFPNPVSSTLNYQLQTGISKHSVHVRDYSGKVIMNNTIAESGTDNSIDMSHLSNGLYIIQISDKGFNRTFKIQKQ